MATMSDFIWPGFDPASPGHKTLRSFLVLDIQASEEFAREFGQGIKAYQNRQQANYAGSGNGYEFACRSEGMYFDCLYDGDPLTPVVVDYATVLTALAAWCERTAPG
jgi:hypothetical protein